MDTLILYWRDDTTGFVLLSLSRLSPWVEHIPSRAGGAVDTELSGA